MPSFEFNKKTRLYFKDGRPVSPETLRSWVAEVLERARGEMASVTEDFIGGGINRAAWTLEMKAAISGSHGAMAMLAQGGRDAMDAEAWRMTGQKIKSELEYLRGFERAIANNEAGTEAGILARAGKYADALYPTYVGAALAREKAAGVMRVLRVLGDPQTGHCEDCPGLAGEYDIDEVPAIGDSECGNACNCEIISVELEAA